MDQEESVMNDPHLIDVSKEARRLEREVADAEWDNDPRLESLVRELNYYKDLQTKGVLHEPNF